MSEKKFRVYDKEAKEILYKPYGFLCYDGTPCYIHNVTKIPLAMKTYKPLQFTGLKDKSGLTEIYEGDVIGIDGLKKGNVYENADMVKEKTNFVIQGLCTSAWEATNKEAMDRGCRYSE